MTCRITNLSYWRVMEGENPVKWGKEKNMTNVSCWITVKDVTEVLYRIG